MFVLHWLPETRTTLIPVPVRSLNRHPCSSAGPWNWCNSMAHTHTNTHSAVHFLMRCVYITSHNTGGISVHAQREMSATESLSCVHTCQPYCQNQSTAGVFFSVIGLFSEQILDYMCIPAVCGWLVYVGEKKKPNLHWPQYQIDPYKSMKCH